MFVIWVIVLGIFIYFVIVNVIRLVFEYESLDKCIFVWCECVVGVILSVKINRIGVEFDLGY